MKILDIKKILRETKRLSKISQSISKEQIKTNKQIQIVLDLIRKKLEGGN